QAALQRDALDVGPRQELLSEKHTLLRRVISPVLNDCTDQDLGGAGDLHKMDVVSGQLNRELGEFLVARNRYDVGASPDVLHFSNVRVPGKERFGRIVDPRVGLG